MHIKKMPGEWDRLLAVLRESLVVLPQLLAGVAPDRLRRAPAPREWSAHVIVCHLVLNEMNSAVSLRLILTQDQPSLAEIEDDRCAARFAALYPETQAALDVWRTLREDNLRLCASLSPDDRDRMGRVPWNDKGVSLRSYVESRGLHDIHHIAQIRAALT
jgi:hypothetical protein